jgi:tetrahydromethanopterin S-methyltransferase subunit G
MKMAEPSLERLQVMVQRVLDRLSEHSDEFKEVKLRLGSLERSVLSLRSDMVGDAHVVANSQAQLDRISARMDEVEQRREIAG